jgi:exodeoxyribonuclease-5
METFKQEFERLFLSRLNFTPNEKQGDAIRVFGDFLCSAQQFRTLILAGYAGTGKTSLIGNLVGSLQLLKRRTVLLAPTGRAAKVFSGFAGQKAFTIHKKIYRKKKIENGSVQLDLSPNLTKGTLFIVDEASMIADYSATNQGAVSERNLLEDLLNYVFSGENCALILVGDEGQLPPVGSDFSPALNPVYLKHHFPKLAVSELKLTEVMRQQSGSFILKNATLIRSAKEKLRLEIASKQNKDLFAINGLEFQDKLEEAYNFSGPDETIIITRSNKRANAYNQEVRKRILYFEDEICSGDVIMAVKNNYFWVPETSEAGFIANGEILKVVRIFRKEELHGFSFQHAEAELIDYPDMGSFKIILMLDTLYTEGPSLPREQMKNLFFEVEKDYADERNKKTRYEKILADPYFNALQVKFAYAVTCHKAQGGQWEQVFLDHGYLDENLDESFFRWLYTGFTRAREKLFLVNFDERFM